MAFEYKLSKDGGHVTVVGKGELTVDDSIKLLKIILKDPKCSPDQTALIDLRKATFPNIEGNKILTLANLIEDFEFMFKNNIAIIAQSSTLLAAELLSFHVRTAKNISIRVFLDGAAALEYCMQGWPSHGTALSSSKMPITHPA
jgi:hypothetical protein